MAGNHYGNPMQRLKGICAEALPSRYGGRKLEDAEKRAGHELQMIQAGGWCGKHLFLHDLIKESGLRPSQYLVRGNAAGSIVCHLLAITHADPLDDDLPLYGEFFTGWDGEKEPLIELNVDADAHERVVQAAEALPDAFDKSRIFASSSLTLNARLEQMTGCFPADDDIKSEEISNLFMSTKPLGIRDGENHHVATGLLGIPGFLNFRILRIVEMLCPKSYGDIAKCEGLFHGTGAWDGNGEELVRDATATVLTLPAFREDVYEALLAHRYEKKRAFEVADEVGSGRFAKGKSAPEVMDEMAARGLPEWLTVFFGKTGYLYSRAHAAEYALSELRSLYYKLHYPDRYYPLYFELFGNDAVREHYFSGQDRYKEFERKAYGDTMETFYHYLVWTEERMRKTALTGA